MDVSKLSTRVEEYNSEFSDFELNRKMMIMKATTSGLLEDNSS